MSRTTVTDSVCVCVCVITRVLEHKYHWLSVIFEHCSCNLWEREAEQWPSEPSPARTLEGSTPPAEGHVKRPSGLRGWTPAPRGLCSALLSGLLVSPIASSQWMLSVSTVTWFSGGKRPLSQHSSAVEELPPPPAHRGRAMSPFDL